jgi:hypothetical protein
MKCENCEKNDAVKYSRYSNGRFCSKECARSYSTKNKRSEINEKVSKRLKGKTYNTKSNKIKFHNTKQNTIKDHNERWYKIKKCNFCKCTIDNNKKSNSCDGCKYWIKNVILFKKMGTFVDGIPLEEINKKTLNILYDLYFNKMYSVLHLKEYYDLRENTTYNYFKKNGIHLRTLSKAASNAYNEGRRLPQSTQSYKHGWHTTWDGKQVYYRSSYELRYAKELDEKQIPYEMEFKRFLYWNSEKERWATAIPDFYLPLENKIVEIKSDHSLNKVEMQDKEVEYRNQGYNFELIVMEYEKYPTP